jgi:hypothetical protein
MPVINAFFICDACLAYRMPTGKSPEKTKISANGAISLSAWGLAPGKLTTQDKSAESAFHSSFNAWPTVNRAFSAGLGISEILGRVAPGLRLSGAPLALNTNVVG